MSLCCSLFFFFNHPATTEIYTLSLHDALPISAWGRGGFMRRMAMFFVAAAVFSVVGATVLDRKSTRLNSSHTVISYAVFCLKKKISKEKALRELRKQSASCYCSLVHSFIRYTK